MLRQKAGRTLWGERLFDSTERCSLIIRSWRGASPSSDRMYAGEDWRAIGQLPGVDVSTLHVYERHMERLPALPVSGMVFGKMQESVRLRLRVSRPIPKP